MADLWLGFLSHRPQLHLTRWAGDAASLHLLLDGETGFTIAVEKEIHPKGKEGGRVPKRQSLYW